MCSSACDTNGSGELLVHSGARTHSLPSCILEWFSQLVHAVYTQGNDLEGNNGFVEREDNLLA